MPEVADIAPGILKSTGMTGPLEFDSRRFREFLLFPHEARPVIWVIRRERHDLVVIHRSDGVSFRRLFIFKSGNREGIREVLAGAAGSLTCVRASRQQPGIWLDAADRNG